MISVQVDEKEVRKIYLEKVEEKVRTVDAELVFWDTNELKRRTCMSWNTIQKEFFFDPKFPKFKVGSKWYFPSQKAKEFLLQWLSER
ncbi:group-specific protein [Bacillus wiedmannii]|uniref:group-specific protein n=1 Tax=Bacillus wiedmannii TaxID=1890302 RepID=UPI00288CC889|nr:group-specific protein [Bacillus thuringiensis]